MLMNRLLSLMLLLVISRFVVAEDVFWVLGSFLEEDVARVDGSRISKDAGIEVLLFEVIVNARVQYRLLTRVLVVSSDEALLRQQLTKVGVPDPWALRFDDDVPYMETIFSDLGAGNTLSVTELAEIDLLLSDFDDEYGEEALANMGTPAEDISSGLVSTTSDELEVNYVVLGSYESTENANYFVSKLGNAFPEILSYELTVQRKQVSGKIFYRVMVGPLLPIEENDLMGALSEWGIRDAWVLQRTIAPVDISLQASGQEQGSDKNISQPQRGFRIPSQLGSQASYSPVKSFGAKDEFNPVSLMKGSPKFPDPRNKH